MLININAINTLEILRTVWLIQWSTNTIILWLLHLKGISVTYRYVGRQKVEIEFEDLALLLSEEEPAVEKLSAASKSQLEAHGEIISMELPDAQCIEIPY